MSEQDQVQQNSAPSSQNQSNGANAASKQTRKVTVNSHSQVIYYYPTMIAALIMGFQSVNEPASSNAGWFLGLLAFNTFIVHFDFSSYRAALMVTAFSTVGILLWHFELLASIFGFLKEIDFRINNHAFMAIGLTFLFMIICDLIWSHLNRWEFSANEVKHIRFLRGSVSLPGRGLALRREINDLFEYILGAGAGQVVIRVGKSKVRLSNVLRAQSKVTRIETFVRSTGVYSDEMDVFDDDDGDDF